MSASDRAEGKPLRALIIEDSEFDAALLVRLLQVGQYRVTWRRVETGADMRQALAEQGWDIIFSDHQMPEFSAPDALQILQETALDLPFIIVSGGIGEATAVALMKAGAHDFLIKGQLGRLIPAVERELREAANRAARREAEISLRESEARYRKLWENSPDAIVMVGADGRIGFANPAVTGVFGYAPSELAGMAFAQLIEAMPAEPDRLSAVPAVPSAEGAEGQAMVQEMKGRHRDGQEVTVEIGFSSLRLEGKTWRVAFIRDLTARRRAESALKEREEEFRVAREVQQRLFPKAAPEIPGYDLAGASFPAVEAGGDYFDYLPMLEGGLGIVVADVSGHGIGPAMIMAETRAFLRIVALNRRFPSEALGAANRVLIEDLADSDRFVTVLMARLDPAARRLAYASAGHPAGLLLDATGAVKQRLTRTGRALGMSPDSAFPDVTGIPLAEGDVLVLMTDGIEEAVDAQGDLFGAERLVEAIRASRHRPAQEILEHLHGAVRRFASGGAASDDITLVVVKVGNAAGADA
ncbi:MAG TPA: SpoIIE family protein phosphatase [Verrucomicrobiota bacterium]|nr:SpoIIE family protein phosphatase [Verrucomicrobiota bacterium]HNU49672.1 SpoIIE family protein phosphatase [Verrucomicrobiota bacterium]